MEGDSVRPTSDRVKEAIFSALNDKMLGSYFLDLFSGSGAIGIEALSRGAKHTAFVEKCEGHVRIINKNLVHVSKVIPELNYKILNEDALDALQRLKASNLNFDIIFLDPPYKMDLWKPALLSIYELGLLNKDGVIVLEMSKDEEEPNLPQFSIERKKLYGQTAVYYMVID